MVRVLAGRTRYGGHSAPPTPRGAGRKEAEGQAGRCRRWGCRWPGVEARGGKVPFFSVPEAQAPNTQSLGPVQGRIRPWAPRKPGGAGGGGYDVPGE